MVGFSSIKLAVLGAMFVLLVTLGTVSKLLWSDLRTRDAKIQSQAHDLEILTADVGRWRAAWADSQNALRRLQNQIDSEDVLARHFQGEQVKTVAQRQLESRAAQNRTSSILQTLKDQVDQHATATSSVIHEGFDPVVLAGIRWLQCLQSASRTGADTAKCQGGATLPTGKSYAVGPTARAGRYAPTVSQQLWLLGLVYRFREWGAACYADKDAIMVAQDAASKVGKIVNSHP
jgi:hypothetical protein